jgi:hypothetical protein
MCVLFLIRSDRSCSEIQRRVVLLVRRFSYVDAWTYWILRRAVWCCATCTWIGTKQVSTGCAARGRYNQMTKISQCTLVILNWILVTEIEVFTKRHAICVMRLYLLMRKISEDWSRISNYSPVKLLPYHFYLRLKTFKNEINDRL